MYDSVYQEVYGLSMEWQEEEAENLGAKVFKFNDHYASFYLSTPIIYGAKAPELVAGKLDTDYMNPENIKIYKELCDKMEQWENMTTDEQDENDQIYDEAGEICDRLADGITEQLRAYENLTEEQIEEEWERMATEGPESDWETDGEKVYQTIIKVYK